MAIKKATLVLEGGATRGVFTSGVLDYLMDQDLYMSHVIGVSAGAWPAADICGRLCVETAAQDERLHDSGR